MTKILFKTLLVSVSAVLLLTSCDKNNNVLDENTKSFELTTASSLVPGIMPDGGIPAEYDAIGRDFAECYATISLALIEKNIGNPTIEDVKDAAMSFYEERYPDFDTSILDTLDFETGNNDFLTNAQEEVLIAINEIISTTNINAFEQKIPTMSSIICTLPNNERGPLFVYLSTIKYVNIINTGINTSVATGKLQISNPTLITQGFWKWLGNAACAVWGVARYVTAVSPAAAVPFVDGACVAYALAQVAVEVIYTD